LKIDQGDGTTLLHPTTMPPKSARNSIQANLPPQLRKAVINIWDSSKLWGKAKAANDYAEAYRADNHMPKSNTFALWSTGHQSNIRKATYLGRYPGHYLEHVVRLNYMHAWCRDLLFLGNWNDFEKMEDGPEIREGALRLMRYLNRVRNNFIRECRELLMEDGDDGNIPLKVRVPSFDFHLLALYNDLGYTPQEFKIFLSDESGKKAFAVDPIALGMYINLMSVMPNRCVDWAKWQKETLTHELNERKAKAIGTDYVALHAEPDLTNQGYFGPLNGMETCLKLLLQRCGKGSDKSQLQVRVYIYKY
jgi:hypothetical protein